MRNALAAALAVVLSFAIPLAAAAAAYADVAVVAPANEQTVHDNQGNVVVQVAVRPGLNDTDQVVLLLDGQPVAHAPATTFPLTGVERGSHAIEAQIVDSNGNVLAASRPVVFHMWQASKLFPNRKAPKK